MFNPNIYSAQPSAEDVVRNTTNSVLDRLNAAREQNGNREFDVRQILSELIIPHFDFETMARLVMEDFWHEMDRKQRECFTASFKNILTERYAYVLLSYDDHHIDYQAARPIGKRDYVSVRQIISREGSPPLPVDYPMHRKGSQWQIVDLVIDDISLIKSFSNSYGLEARIYGLDRFLETMPLCPSF